MSSPLPFSWKEDLERTLGRIGAIATGSTELIVVNAVQRVALAFPDDPGISNLVLALYQPKRLTGRAFKAAVGLMNRMHAYPRCHRHQPGSTVLPELAWLQDAARAGTIGFLGCNPSHGPRCILAGILPDSGETFIAKLGLDESAHAVAHECRMLAELGGRYPGIPRPLGQQQGGDWFVMRLPHLGNASPHTMSAPGISDLLQSWASDRRTRLGESPWARGLIRQACVSGSLSGWHERMESISIGGALVHGDFAVWNLRYTNEGIRAIDWEWAEPEGVAGIDLVHGLRQEAYMIRRLSASASIAWMLEQARTPAWSAYLDRAGWTGHLEDWLRLGLLHSHYRAKNDSWDLLEHLGIHVE